MADDQGQVRVDHLQGFRTFATGMTDVRGTLRALGVRHLDLVPPARTFPLADVSGEMANLRGTNNAAVGRLDEYGTRADRGLTGLAFVAMHIATSFVETDAAAADKIAEVARLGTEAEGCVPPVPPTAPRIDPTLQSPPETPAERQQRLALPVQPGRPG